MLYDIAKLEKTLGYTFKNKKLFWEALTFKSFRHKNPKWKYGSNNRMSLLGDSILDFVVTEELLFKHPCKDAGEITREYIEATKNDKLSKIAESMHLGKYLLIMRRMNVKSSGISSYHMASSVEAIIAAIYIDGGFDAAKKFIMKHIIGK